MDSCHCKPNMSIECNVTSCDHHCQSQNFCSLEHIKIGTHETQPSMQACTDCLSFRKK